MVETRDREIVYTTSTDTGPSTALAIVFSLMILAVVGFMIYFFSSNALENRTPSLIERDTTTSTTNTNTPVAVPTPTPVPVPVPMTGPGTSAPEQAAPAPAPAPASSDSSSSQ